MTHPQPSGPDPASAQGFVILESEGWGVNQTHWAFERRAEANENTTLTCLMRVQILINDFSRCMSYVKYCLRSAGLFISLFLNLIFKNICFVFLFFFYITTKEHSEPLRRGDSSSTQKLKAP